MTVICGTLPCMGDSHLPRKSKLHYISFPSSALGTRLRSLEAELRETTFPSWSHHEIKSDHMLLFTPMSPTKTLQETRYPVNGDHCHLSRALLKIDYIPLMSVHKWHIFARCGVLGRLPSSIPPWRDYACRENPWAALPRTKIYYF